MGTIGKGALVIPLFIATEDFKFVLCVMYQKGY